MNKKVSANVLRRVSVLLIAALLLVGAVAAPQAEAADFKASYIDKLDKSEINLNTESYFDSNVIYKLPDSVKDDDEISVIITLDVITLKAAYDKSDKSMTLAEFVLSEEAGEIRHQIKTEKTAVLDILDQKAISYRVGADYDTLLSGFELLIKAGDLNLTTKAMPSGAKLSVGEVYKTADTQLVENKVSIYEDTGIFNGSTVDFDGSGMVVAVLDTGIDYAHSAFSTKNFTSNKLGLTYEQVVALMDKTTAATLSAGLSADDVYINEKIPFSFDYADADPDAYSDHNNHGTHVSGIICGKDDTITGVAPNAQLVSMKVFSSVMDTARSAWILSALEDCVVLGVDVINMSLGQSAGFASPSLEEIENGVYDDIREAGISLIVAASNSYASHYGSESNGNLGLTSNPDSGTVGSPGTYLPSLSVASINGKKTPYLLYGETIMYFSQTTNAAAEENDFLETLLGDNESVDIEFVLVPGVGRTADYTGLDVNGKIALVRRGDNTFEEKAIIAQNQGAAGIIIYNNVSGDIKMNVGDATLAACSISQDMGEILAAAGSGTIKVAHSQKSGPFIDDFSSWGPTPSLGIKPEITAHGGNILSAVTGGDYDRMSGTSMATPNVAGLSLLLRQYIVENFPEIANDSVAVNTLMNQMMMSTADIILNKNGLPYAVRKQGAGLANLDNCVNTDAIIITYDADGKAMDKTKLELKDDPNKTGVYKMSFTVKNFGSAALSYDLGAYVLTEGVSETLTATGETTITENAYVLAGATLEFTAEGGSLSDKNLTVEAGKEAKVSVTITLSDEDKKYMDDSFANGMYVEGFITLTATAGTQVNMNVPYLAFYGDWTKAPVLDLDYFETDKYERDELMAPADKILADGYATRPIGGVSGDYVSYLGSYYFVQDPKDEVISASRDYVALSNQDGTIHSLSFIWAGMLRNAAKIVVTITDDTTGEVVYEVVDDFVRKSYGDGGPIRPANVEVEFDTMDYNLANNTEYTVKMVAYMDYGNGGLETNENNVFEFPLVADFQAPTLEDVEFYYEYDKTLKKNRLYAKVAVYDNHHAMALQFGYAYTNAEGNVDLMAFQQYMTPVLSEKDSTTYVTFELTDYVYDIKNYSYNANSFVITCYDYALNTAIYEVGMPDNYTDFYFDSLPTDGLTLSVNETFSLEPTVYPTSEWAELLEFTSSRTSVVRVVNNKLVAVGPGKAVIRVRDPQSGKALTFNVTVLGEGDEGFKKYSKPVADSFEVPGYYTVKAYYQLNSQDKLLGNTGDTRFFEGDYSLTMYPSESVRLNYKLDAYFPNDVEVVYEASNESIVKVDSDGIVTAVAEGFSSVTIKVLQDGKSTPYAMTVTVEVKDPFLNTGASLSHYFGNGGVVQIPSRLHLTSIGAFAFSNYDYLPKTEEELAFDDSTTSIQRPIGDNTITKVIIPEGVERIDSYAFALLTALEEVELPSTLTEIAYNAFYGCEKLQKITFSGENNLKLINYAAFFGCDLRGTLDLSSAYVIGDMAFYGNKNLEGIHLPETLQSIGEYAFFGCESLSDVQVTASQVKYGPYAFMGCTALKSFEIKSSLVPAGMFLDCSNLDSVIIGSGVNAINEYAFRGTKVKEFDVADGNTAFKVQTAPYVISADGKTLVAVAPTVTGQFTAANIGDAQVTTVGRGAFSHTNRLTSVELPSVTAVGAYGFAGDEAEKYLTSVKLGQLVSIGEYSFSATGITQMPAFDVNTYIGKYAFLLSDLTSVTIPDGMSISEGAFSRCKNLVSVTIGNDVTLGDFAFFQDFNDSFEIAKKNENGVDLFYYVFKSKLNELTIGNNAIIGNNAFTSAFNLETITLGENAVIGNMAFHNCQSLKNIDLSKAQSIGDYAFSGDNFNMFFDSTCTTPAYSTEGKYLYTFHSPALESVDLSAATSVGKYAFATCRNLSKVVLGENVTEIPEFAFAQTPALKDVNLSKVQVLGDGAFRESGLVSADLSAANSIGKYVFTNCLDLADLTLSAGGTNIGEGSFAYCEKLTTVGNLNASAVIGDYAFAYTGITKADLSSAESIGTQAFLKDEKGTFEVTLGDKLAVLGDNPFAGSVLAPFSSVAVETVNGVDYESVIYTYQITDTVSVVDGSLYCKVPNGGMELITFAGTDLKRVQVADNTVRISAMAFANSDVQMVSLPHTVAGIGHKAFFGCQKLNLIEFTSYQAPTLEEEFDASYYESLKNIPGSGDYGTYEDYDGTIVTIEPLGIIPYFMWNATGGQYSNVFYGANFIDYVGKVENKLLMIRPANGQKYETYMFGHYFDNIIDGGAAMDANTLAFIDAMSKLPERITLEHKPMVEAATAAYNKMSNTLQKGLVENLYSQLISAQQRIAALESQGNEGAQPPVQNPEEPGKTSVGLIIAIVAAVVVVIAGVVVAVVLKKRKAAPAEEIPAAVEAAEEAAETEEAQGEAEEASEN